MYLKIYYIITIFNIINYNIFAIKGLNCLKYNSYQFLQLKITI